MSMTTTISSIKCAGRKGQTTEGREMIGTTETRQFCKHHSDVFAPSIKPFFERILRILHGTSDNISGKPTDFGIR
jgi:hypothetical protein